MNLDLLLYWMRERESIRRRRLARELPPWTRDPILQQWSFCNVRREHDRVTRWIAANWRYPHADDPDLWFAMVVARFMNEPDTLREIGFPVPWDPERFLRVMASRRARGAKLYRNDAYRIRADNRLGRPTPEYQVADVFGPCGATAGRCGPGRARRSRAIIGGLAGITEWATALCRRRSSPTSNLFPRCGQPMIG